jgi:hypothetical protein
MEMRSIKGLRGEYTNKDNSNLTGGDTYTRRLRQYEAESARAREKFSFDTPSTPSSSAKRSNNGGTPINSPWWKTKSPTARRAASHESSAGEGNTESGRRMYGPFKRNFNEETGSLESWEETWFNLGNEDADAPPSSSAQLNSIDEGEGVAGPGQSWRKLV